MKKIICPYCKNEMNYICEEKIQLGQYKLLTGAINNYLSGSLPVAIYNCPECGKIDFFSVTPIEMLPQIKCSKCNRSYDFDSPKCPYCKAPNEKIV